VAARARRRPRRPAISEGPRLRVEPFTTGGDAGAWVVTWHVVNEGDRPLRIATAQHPHSQFRTPETPLDIEIAPGASADLTLPVRFSESPGVVVENAFLIVRLRERDEWRVLARVSVTAGTRGEPLAGRSVVVTIQRVQAA
jgi:hypothetical protein